MNINGAINTNDAIVGAGRAVVSLDVRAVFLYKSVVLQNIADKVVLEFSELLNSFFCNCKQVNL